MSGLLIPFATVATLAAAASACLDSGDGDPSMLASPDNPQECPATEPAQDAECPVEGGITCEYSNTGGSSSDATCDAGNWEVARHEGPSLDPPADTGPAGPFDSCPSDEPEEGSACNVSSEELCTWSNCDGPPTLEAKCTAGAWEHVVARICYSAGPVDWGDPAEVIDWTQLHECDDTDPSDSIDVLSASVDGDTLTLDISHSSGCAVHTYGLCYDPSWTEGEPVGVPLRVLHDAGDETCEALAQLEISFDLTPLRQAYEEAYQTDTGRIQLGIVDSPIYSFGGASL